jgi:carbon-monoxide dehydrogenase medium subunit
VIPRFDYYRPKTLEELLSLISKCGEDAKLLAGGTDLLVLLRDRVVKPKCVVDIKGVAELHELKYDEHDGLRVGAAVTFRELLEHPIVRERYRALWDAASVLADPVIRNRATLVGNICNASPAADSAPPLLVFDAEVEIVGANESRVVPISKFFVGVKRTVVGPGELVRAVRIPQQPADAKSRYYKWGRTRGEDLAVVGVAIRVADSGKDVRIALSSVYKTPIRIGAVEEIFKNGGAVEEKIARAVEAVKRGIAPISDVRGSREYRIHMAGVLTKRGLEELLGVR